MKIRKVRRGLGCLVLAVAGGPCGAAEEDIYFSTLPVVASVSRLPQALRDAPGSVTVIDRDMIRASGVRDLNDIFRLVPGFQTYPFNTDMPPKVSYHGLTDDEFAPRVQVLVDGRSMYSPLFRGGVNWATIPIALEDIERIEVIRGSNSAAYGSNAFLGVINIISVDPSQVRGTSVSASHGNQGVRDSTLRTGGRIGSASDFRFTYQQRDDNGLTDQFDWKDGFRQRLFDFRAGFALSERDDLQVSAGHVEGTSLNGRYLTGQANGQPIVLAPRREDPCAPFYDVLQSNTFLQLAWRRALAADEDLQVRYAHSEDWASGNHVEQCTNTRYNGDRNLLYQVDLYGDKGSRDEIEVQHTFSPWDRTRLVWGGGGRWETTRSSTMFHGDPAVNRQVWRLFGNLEWKPSHWLTVNAGSTAEEDSLAGATFSPRLSANFHLDGENTLRIGAARAHRTPSAIDLRGDRWKSPFSTATGTPIPIDQLYVRRVYADRDVKPERIDSLELGYLGDWKAQRMSLDVRLFNERIPNRIVDLTRELPSQLCQVSSGPPFNCTTATANFSANAESVVTEGVEYQWRWQPLEDTRLLFNQAFVHIRAHYLAGIDMSRGTNFLDGDKITSSSETLTNAHRQTVMSAPSRSATAMLMQRLPLGVEFSATQYWVGKMKWSRNSVVAPYRRLDLRLAYPFRIGNTGGEIAYVLQSANGEHGEFKYDPTSTDRTAIAAGRVVSERQWLTFRLDFQ